MGTLTRSQFDDELVYMLDGRDDIDSSRRLRWLNWALLHVCNPRVYRHRELERSFNITLATDDIDYSITSATLGRKLWQIHDLMYVAGTSSTDTTLRREKLRQVEMRTLDGITVRATGEPEAYAIFGEQIILDRRPTATENGNLMVLRAYVRPTQFAASTDTATEIPDEWDEVILMGARWLGWSWLGLPERAEIAREEFVAAMNEIPSQKHLDAEDPGRAVSFAQPNYVGGRY